MAGLLKFQVVFYVREVVYNAWWGEIFGGEREKEEKEAE